MPSKPRSTQSRASSCGHDALDDDRNLDELPDLVQVLPGVPQAARRQRDTAGRAATRGDGGALRAPAEPGTAAPRPIVAVPSASGSFARPLRPDARHPPRLRVHRRGRPARAAAQIAIVLAALVVRRLLIDGDDDRGVAGALRALEQLLARAHVLPRIELPPQLSLRAFRHLLDRLARVVAEAHRRVRRQRAPRDTSPPRRRDAAPPASPSARSRSDISD